MSVFQLFLLLLKASFLSFGGLASLPILHEDLISRGVTEAMFGQALAVGRISPGPNGLYIVSLAYEIDGLLGAIAATVAIMLPPFVILAIVAWYGRIAHLPRTRGAMNVLSLGLAGLLGLSSWLIAAGSATNWIEWAAPAVVFVLMLRMRWHPLFLLLGAAAVGVMVYH